ncbi:MAG: hypothetical protein LBU87_02105 [Lactobacillales bacterium]|jgi:hypothetical protein|nr:hypothetical protein [Lactobacillales bacterium]
MTDAIKNKEALFADFFKNVEQTIQSQRVGELINNLILNEKTQFLNKIKLSERRMNRQPHDIYTDREKHHAEFNYSVGLIQAQKTCLAYIMSFLDTLGVQNISMEQINILSDIAAKNFKDSQHYAPTRLRNPFEPIEQVVKKQNFFMRGLRKVFAMKQPVIAKRRLVDPIGSTAPISTRRVSAYLDGQLFDKQDINMAYAPHLRDLIAESDLIENLKTLARENPKSHYRTSRRTEHQVVSPKIR